MVANILLAFASVGAEGFFGWRPNPVSGQATLDFVLPHVASVAIDVYDVIGRRVREVAFGSFAAGPHTTTWDLRGDGGQRVAGGVYFLRLATEGRVLSHSLIVQP